MNVLLGAEINITTEVAVVKKQEMHERKLCFLTRAPAVCGRNTRIDSTNARFTPWHLYAQNKASALRRQAAQCM